eukprot:g371.t1
MTAKPGPPPPASARQDPLMNTVRIVKPAGGAAAAGTRKESVDEVATRSQMDHSGFDLLHSGGSAAVDVHLQTGGVPTLGALLRSVQRVLRVARDKGVLFSAEHNRVYNFQRDLFEILRQLLHKRPCAYPSLLVEQAGELLADIVLPHMKEYMDVFSAPLFAAGKEAIRNQEQKNVEAAASIAAIPITGTSAASSSSSPPGTARRGGPAYRGQLGHAILAQHLGCLASIYVTLSSHRWLSRNRQDLSAHLKQTLPVLWEVMLSDVIAATNAVLEQQREHALVSHHSNSSVRASGPDDGSNTIVAQLAVACVAKLVHPHCSICPRFLPWPRDDGLSPVLSAHTSHARAVLQIVRETLLKTSPGVAKRLLAHLFESGTEFQRSGNFKLLLALDRAQELSGLVRNTYGDSTALRSQLSFLFEAKCPERFLRGALWARVLSEALPPTSHGYFLSVYKDSDQPGCPPRVVEPKEDASAWCEHYHLQHLVIALQGRGEVPEQQLESAGKLLPVVVFVAKLLEVIFRVAVILQRAKKIENSWAPLQALDPWLHALFRYSMVHAELFSVQRYNGSGRSGGSCEEPAERDQHGKLANRAASASTNTAATGGAAAAPPANKTRGGSSRGFTPPPRWLPDRSLSTELGQLGAEDAAARSERLDVLADAEGMILGYADAGILDSVMQCLSLRTYLTGPDEWLTREFVHKIIGCNRDPELHQDPDSGTAGVPGGNPNGTATSELLRGQRSLLNDTTASASSSATSAAGGGSEQEQPHRNSPELAAAESAREFSHVDFFTLIGRRGMLATLDIVYQFRNEAGKKQEARFKFILRAIECVSASYNNYTQMAPAKYLYLPDRVYSVPEIHCLTALRVLYDLLNRTLCQNKNGDKQIVQWILQSRVTHFVLSFAQKLSHDETLETTSSAGHGNPPPGAKNIPGTFSMATQLLASFVLHHASLAQEFVHANGLGILCGEKDSLSDYVHRAHICVDMLLILSQLSRMSKEYYPAIHKLGIYRELAALLRCPDANIRAKTANVVGNMSRHSDFFYAKLRETGILANLIPLCGDTDATTRKFASFAVGNSAFHSNILYPQLKGAVAPLRDLLLLDGKNDEKCRANAAGALGNLVKKK